MKLAVIGSRGFVDEKLLNETLSSYENITMIVSGGAKGADKLGENWAKKNNIETLIFLPDWDNHGNAAGFIRNQDIIKNCDEAIAFWDGESRGTKSSIDLCKKYGKNCKIILYGKK